MKSFFHPESTLEGYDILICDDVKFDDTILEENQFFTESLKPYVLQGQADSYAGWYDVQGCGICLFAYVTGNNDPSTNYLRFSGVDSNQYIETNVNATT